MTHRIPDDDSSCKLHRGSHAEAEATSSDVPSARWSEIVGLDLRRDL
jgi:hypothetical protein